MSSVKRQIRRFHVVVVQWTPGSGRQRNVLKSVMHVLSNLVPRSPTAKGKGDLVTVFQCKTE